MMIDDLRDALSEALRSFRAQEFLVQRWLIGGILTFVVVTVLAWKVMVPLILFAIGAMLYLRRSRDEDSL
jgi:hypothetical protein